MRVFCNIALGILAVLVILKYAFGIEFGLEAEIREIDDDDE